MIGGKKGELAQLKMKLAGCTALKPIPEASSSIAPIAD